MANLTPQALFADVAGLVIDLLFSGGNGAVGIFNQLTFIRMFGSAQPIKARILPSAKIMEHPVETGATIADFKVILPREIELILAVKSNFYLSTYQQIVAAFNNSTLLSVQTHAAVFPNMIIQAMPHEEDPDKYDLITMSLRLREVMFVAPLSITQIQNGGVNITDYDPADPTMNNTTDRGQQSSFDASYDDEAFFFGE